MKFLKSVLGNGKDRQAVSSAGTQWEADQQAVIEILKHAFGCEPTVFAEGVSEHVPLDILCFPPIVGRSFWVFGTLGMSSKRMQVPDGGDPAIWGRAEMLVGLDGEIGETVSKMMSGKMPDGPGWWPIQYLKFFARFPHANGAFVSDGHTLTSPGGQPFSSSTEMDAALVGYCTLLPEEQVRSELPCGDKVTFYGLTYLYGREVQILTENGIDALYDYMDETGVSEVLYADRRLCIS